MRIRIGRLWSQGRLLKSVALLATAVTIFFLYFWQLAELTSGLSQSEIGTIKGSLGWQNIVTDPLNLAHKVPQYILLQFDGGIFTARLPSALFIALFVGLFYLMVKLWFGEFIGLMGAILLASTPLVIILARQATTGIMLLFIIAIITAHLWLSKRDKYRSFAWISLCTTVALGLYIPGLVWFIAPAFLIVGKKTLRMTKTINHWAVTCGFGLLILLTIPLVLAIINTPSLVPDLAAIPDRLPGPIEFVKTLGWTVLSIFWHQPLINEFSVGRLPILSLAVVFLSIFGAFALWTRARGVLHWLVAILLGSITLSALNKSTAFLLPTVMVASVLAAAGLRYLFVEWNSIFPKNPIPRVLALILIGAVVGINFAYGVRYGLFAWPNTPQTKAIYVLEYPLDTKE